MLRALAKVVALPSSSLRSFHLTALSRLREIVVEKKDEKTTVIDCKYVKSPRQPYLLKTEKNNKCPLCKLQLQLKYTDVLILSQYLDCNGHMIEPWNTDLCREQYKLVKELIFMAQHAGLLPEPARSEPKKPYQLLNTYFDETTINLRPRRTKHHPRSHYLKRNLSPIEKFRIKPDVGPYYMPKLY